MPILLFISLFTLLDFVVLFSVGSQIGLWITLLLVLLTGVAGLHLIRREGVATLARARQRMANGELPSGELLTGAALIFGGALLLAPGFLSDALGFACLIPNARKMMVKVLTWLGLRASAPSRQPPPGQEQTADDDWQSSRNRSRASSSSRQQQESSDAQDGTPLEGDFISRDEPSRRR
ncbi:FxsA family protein [Halomonas sp. Bachu 37]|uniref:FxsA family protein n=1 Tax=Halomonas kashgarensis TaxID=3084920 RepID=UPI0032175288